MKVERCKVLKTYSGEEGRPKYGDIFIVDGEPVPGMVKISHARYRQLRKNMLVEPLGDLLDATPHGRKADEGRKTKVDPPAPNKVRGPDQKKAPAKKKKSGGTGTGQARGSARSKTSEQKSARPRNGSPDGQPEQPASSSAAGSQRGGSAGAQGDPAASTTSESGKRGKRRGSRSGASTTHGSSPHSGTSSTHATSDGGESTKNPADDSAGLE